MTSRLVSILLSFILLCAFSACKKNPCRNVDCATGTVCIEGECISLAGFVGEFNTMETCVSAGADEYILILTPSPDNAEELILDNLYDASTPCFGVLTSASTMEIPAQEFGLSTLTGHGVLEDGIIQLEFTITLPDMNTIDCTAIMERP